MALKSNWLCLYFCESIRFSAGPRTSAVLKQGCNDRERTSNGVCSSSDPHMPEEEGGVEVGLAAGGDTKRETDRQAVSKVDKDKDELKGNGASLCKQPAPPS